MGQIFNNLCLQAKNKGYIGKFMRRNNQKSFAVDIDSQLLKEFTDQYLGRGYKKFKALEGAIRLWVSIGSAEQTQWIEGKVTQASDDDLDEQIRQFARDFAALTGRLKHRAAASSQKTSKRSRGTG